jgi:hypothetical protein
VLAIVDRVPLFPLVRCSGGRCIGPSVDMRGSVSTRESHERRLRRTLLFALTDRHGASSDRGAAGAELIPPEVVDHNQNDIESALRAGECACHRRASNGYTRYGSSQDFD